MLQALEQKFPCSPLESSVVWQAVLLQPVEVCDGAEISAKSVQDPMLDMSGGRCSMRRNHAGADFLAGAVVQNSCWDSLLLKDCAPWKEAPLEQLMKDCVLWKGLHVAAEEQHEKEGVAGRSCYGLIHTPFSTLLCHTRERHTEVRGEGLKLNLGRRGRRKCF